MLSRYQINALRAAALNIMGNNKFNVDSAVLFVSRALRDVTFGSRRKSETALPITQTVAGAVNCTVKQLGSVMAGR
jgi:hypothetical protein